MDEYQDIAAGQYDLISALAGRTRTDEDGRLSLLAVGDDDQNIYAFNGASVEFIRRFEDGLLGPPGVPDGELPVVGQYHRRFQSAD